jgi:hypothetical protein
MGRGATTRSYEEKGNDYPVGFVRWTEQRNFEAVLDMMADGRLDVKPLISHRFAIEHAEAAYALVGGQRPSLGILLEYPAYGPAGRLAAGGYRSAVAFVGSGNYATAVLIPAFKAAGAHLASVASSAGVSGVHAASKYGFDETTTDTDSLFADPKVDALVITTRHNSHAGFVLQALAAGKHVFVEKPICLTLAELDEIEAAHARLEEQGRRPW